MGLRGLAGMCAGWLLPHEAGAGVKRRSSSAHGECRGVVHRPRWGQWAGGGGQSTDCTIRWAKHKPAVTRGHVRCASRQ